MPIPATPPELIREDLLGRLDEHLQRNQRVVGRLRHDAALPDNWRDRAALLSDEEVLASLDDEARAEVVGLRAALARLDAGTYGTCTVCGEPIAPARLAALATAVTCVGCAE